MAAERTAARVRAIDIDDIIRRGLNALSDAIDTLAAIPEDHRDEKFHYRNLASCVEAAAHLQREQREQTQWLAEQNLNSEQLRRLLLAHLGTMDPGDLGELIDQAKKEARAS